MGWCPFKASRKTVGAHRGFVTSTVKPAAAWRASEEIDGGTVSTGMPSKKTQRWR
jgi:hypothetical protein